MTRAYGFDEAGIRRIREAVRRSEKTPRVGAQQRRIQPVLTGSELQLFQITETVEDEEELEEEDEGTPTWINSVGGSSGIRAVRVTRYRGWTALPDIDEDEDQIFADFTRGIFFTGDIVVAEKIENRLQIRSESRFQWTGVAEADITGGTGNVLVQIPVPGDGLVDYKEVSIEGELYDPAESVSEGSQCMMLYMSDEFKFRIIPVACPAPDVEAI